MIFHFQMKDYMTGPSTKVNFLFIRYIQKNVFAIFYVNIQNYLPKPNFFSSLLCFLELAGRESPPFSAKQLFNPSRFVL